MVALPYDSEQYVRQALTSPFSIGVPAGYPVWLKVSHLTAVPQRLIIETFFLFSCGILCAAIKEKFGKTSALVAFLLLAAYPSTYFMLDHALSDGFYACLTLLALASTCFLLFFRTRTELFLAALSLGGELGWMAYTRNEDPLIVLWGAAVIFFLYVLRRNKFEAYQKISFKNFSLATLLVILTPILMVQSLSIAHYFATGVYTRNLSSLPSHMEFLGKLAAIDTHAQHIKSVPISFKARQLAYQASPTLKKFEKSIENPDGVYQAVSRASGLPVGEIGAGWIWHVFSDSIFQGLNTGGVVSLDNTYKQINKELDAAFSSDILQRRFVLHPFLTAPISEVLQRLPGSVWAVGKRSFNAYPRGIDQGFEKNLFDRLLLRRTSLSGSGDVHTVQGWAFFDSPGMKISHVFLVTKGGKRTEATSYFDRIDVAEGYERERKWKPDVIGFRARLEGEADSPVKVVYVLASGEEVQSQAGLIAGQVSKLDGADGLVVMQGVDVAETDSKMRNGWRQKFQLSLVSFVNTDWVAITLLISLVALTSLSMLTPRVLGAGQYGVTQFCSLVFLLFALRVLFYAVVNSEAWMVEVRYLLAAGLMALIVLSLVLGRLFDSSKLRSLGF